MEYLFDGVKGFNADDYPRYKEHFQTLGRRQKPHTLFIGCSDSRVVPNLITRTLPGELFVVRNIANIVPLYRKSEEFLATTAAIEYALAVLEVENIVVCGHSNCGGCNALYMTEESSLHIPHTRKWLELAAAVKEKVERIGVTDPFERELTTEQINIVEQMNHLVTYPSVKERYRAGTLNILGWHYIIESGDVFNYDKNEKRFVRIE